MAGDPTQPGPGRGKAKAKVPVEVEAVGLKKFGDSMGGFADVMLEPLALLALGATKTQAAWAGLAGFLEYKMLGPMGLLSGAALGALVNMKKLTNEWKEMGKESAASLQTLETQFKPLLGSVALATERVEELVEITKATPFKQEGVIKANKNLQILTQGTLATKEGMLLVGDAAATAGADLEIVSTWVGRLYDALQSGAPIGMATMRMQEMGLMTGNTRRQLVDMQESNAGFADMWGVVEGELRKAEGAMNDLSVTLDGLQSTVEDTRDILQGSFSLGFQDGEEDALASQIAVMEAFIPLAKKYGQILSRMSNKLQALKRAFIESVFGSELFRKAIEGVAITVSVLLGAAVAQGVVFTSMFIGQLVKLALVAKANKAEIAGMTKAMQLHNKINGKSTSILKRLVEVGKLMAAGKYKEAAATLFAAFSQDVSRVAAYKAAKADVILLRSKRSLTAATANLFRGNFRLAASQYAASASATILAFRTNKLATSKILAAAASRKLASGLLIVTKFLGKMIATMVINPVYAFTVVVLAAVTAIILLSHKLEEARKAAEAFNQATKDMVSNMEAQIRAIRTVNDLMKAQNTAMGKLVQAKKALADAERHGTAREIANAKNRVDETQRLVDKTQGIDRKGLAFEDEEKSDIKRKRAEAKKLIKLERQSKRKEMSPEELAADLRAELQEAVNDQFRAEKEQEALVKTREDQNDLNIKSENLTEGISTLESKIEIIREDRDSYESALAHTHFGSNKSLENLHKGTEGLSDEEKKAHYLRKANHLLWRGNIFQDDKNSFSKLAGKSKYRNLDSTEKQALNLSDDELQADKTTVRVSQRLADFSKLEQMEKELAELKEQKLNSKGYELGLSSESRESVLRTRIAIRSDIGQKDNEIKELTDDEGKLKEDAEATPEQVSANRSRLEILRQEKDVLMTYVKGIKIPKPDWWDENPEVNGAWKIEFDGSTGAGRQGSLDELNLEQVIKENNEDIDKTKIKDKESISKSKDKEILLANARSALDLEKAINGLRDEGLAKKLEALKLEEADLELIRKKMSYVEFINAQEAISLRREHAKAEAVERASKALSGIYIKNKRLDQEAARRSGDRDTFKASRARADRREDSLFEENLKKQAKNLFFIDKDHQADFVKENLDARQRARKQQYDFDEEDKQFDRDQSESQTRESFLKIREDLKREVGDTKGADIDEKAADKEADERNLEAYRKKYIDQEYSAEDADRLAKQDVLKDQIGREREKIDELGDGKTVAHSLAKIGGGGAVKVYDPFLAKQEIANNILKKIEEHVRPDQNGGDTLKP